MRLAKDTSVQFAAQSVSMPQEKCDTINQLLASWLSNSFLALRKDTEGLHGKLVYLASIFPLICPFLPGLVAWGCHYQSNHGRLYPSPVVLHNLWWVAELLPLLPVELPLS